MGCARQGSSSIERDAHGGGGGERRADQRDQQARARAAKGRAGADNPARTASAAPAPKISTGTYSGRTSSASRLPPPRSAERQRGADRAQQRQDRRAEQQRRASAWRAIAGSSAYCSPSSGASTTTGNPSSASARASCRTRAPAADHGDSAICSSVPSAKSRGEQPRQRQQRREQRGDPQHAGTERHEQRAFGRRRQRKQRDHDHVEQELHAEFRARAQRDSQVARERPANAGTTRTPLQARQPGSAMAGVRLRMRRARVSRIAAGRQSSG